MLKKVLLGLAAIPALLLLVAGLIDKISSLLQLPENISTLWAFSKFIGIPSTISIVILLMACWIDYLEKQDRKQSSLDLRLSRFYRKHKWDSWRSPIKWSAYESLLDSNGMHIEGCHLPKDDDFLRNTYIAIESFRLVGENKTSKPLKIKNAFVQSLVTGDKIPITIDGKPTSEINEIPPHYTFCLKAFFLPKEKLKSRPNGLPAGEFRKNFSYFKFVFETENYTHEEFFDKEEIDLHLYKLITGLEWGGAGSKMALMPKET